MRVERLNGFRIRDLSLLVLAFGDLLCGFSTIWTNRDLTLADLYWPKRKLDPFTSRPPLNRHLTASWKHVAASLRSSGGPRGAPPPDLVRHSLLCTLVQHAAAADARGNCFLPR